MKKLYFFISFILISSYGECQKYIPFDLVHGEWICGYFTKGGFFDSYGNDYVREEVKYYCQGDTLINDTIYKKLFYIGYASPTMTPEKNISGYFGAIRNDTAKKQVWLKTLYRYGT
jgi:hypothetical protein